ncbi:neutral zinc metallopeptidase [Pseudonocardia sp. N23]|uniref:neutral zinc metallopeptidase n=1 Tax=Pseudonocardia sp. N23 TaxID=1987376 RepID=UPI000BFB4D0C|nr:neutral zinc metallopeptidase [Pseudonocardia sp. N23]GAY12371.1 LpqM protein [Pseudonocardia sp. N23]
MAVLSLVLAAVASACVGPTPPPVSAPPTGAATAGVAAVTPTADPALPGRSTDDIARLTVDALQAYWRSALPADLGTPWHDVATIAPVHVDDPSAPQPPCAAKAADLRGNAFYCPTADAVVWDADVLLPQLRERFGPAGVVVVLAHEFGHAVQTRIGVDDAQRTDPAAHPTILLEAMSDCYAGAVIRHLVDATAAGGPVELPMGAAERDSALRALVTFRDPLGILAADTTAHGNAFDRLSAVEDGYDSGPTACAAMTLTNREFTQRRFGSAADRARNGNLPLDRLLPAVAGNAGTWFDGLVAARGVAGWKAPGPRSVPGCTGAGDQGPVVFCGADGGVVTDLRALETLQKRSGDFAGGTLLVSRYALAARGGAQLSTTGYDAGRSAVCLAGAWTAPLVDPAGGFGLSPGDLDEAVSVLLDQDWAETDAVGTVDPADNGFERLGHYRRGFLGGPAACGL